MGSSGIASGNTGSSNANRNPNSNPNSNSNRSADGVTPGSAPRPTPVVPANRGSAGNSSVPSLDATHTSPNTGERRVYKIRSGDSFAGLAQRWFGSERYWRAIAQANPSIDPARLRVEQEIRLPTMDELRRFAPSSATAAAATPPAGTARGDAPRDGEPRHVVRSGESLSTIAQRHYGSAVHWRYLYDQNVSVIGDNPDKLAAGMELVIRPLDD